MGCRRAHVALSAGSACQVASATTALMQPVRTAITTMTSASAIRQRRNGAYLYDFSIVEAFAEASTEIANLPVSLFVDYANNGDAGQFDTGISAGLRLGKAKKAGSWELTYAYQDLEADAVLGLLTDSDFAVVAPTPRDISSRRPMRSPTRSRPSSAIQWPSGRTAMAWKTVASHMTTTPSSWTWSSSTTRPYHRQETIYNKQLCGSSLPRIKGHAAATNGIHLMVPSTGPNANADWSIHPPMPYREGSHCSPPASRA